MEYPTSSCPCDGTKSIVYSQHPLCMTNLSQPCTSDTVSQCFRSPHAEYAQSFQPGLLVNGELPGQGNTLNQLGVRFDGTYRKVRFEKPTPSAFKGECNTGFAGPNCKLVDSYGRGYMLLDRPPLMGDVAVGDVPHDEIYSECFAGYGKQTYKNYHDINTGQIQYYITPSAATAYKPINFVDSDYVQHSVYTDPMGTAKPEYTRIQTRNDALGCDTYTQDAIFHRQDIMASQMQKYLKSDWSARYGYLMM